MESTGDVAQRLGDALLVAAEGAATNERRCGERTSGTDVGEGEEQARGEASIDPSIIIARWASPAGVMDGSGTPAGWSNERESLAERRAGRTLRGGSSIVSVRKCG